MPRILVGALIACLLAVPGHARAEDWPTRPVTMVVPFAAGGPIDVVARLISPRMSELLGQQVVIDNIPGAGGMVGASRVAKSAPDGYTMLVGNQATHTYSQFLYTKPLYDPVADFAPGGMLLSNFKVLVVRKDLAANTLRRIHRLCEGEPGDHAIRLGRRRLGHPHRLPAAQRQDGHQDHPRALSRRRTRACRTWWRAASTSCATWSRPRSRRSAPAR